MSPVTHSVTRGPEGWREVPVRKDGELIAVVTRPISGAKWFLHRLGTGARAEKFPTLKAALAACE